MKIFLALVCNIGTTYIRVIHAIAFFLIRFVESPPIVVIIWRFVSYFIATLYPVGSNKVVSGIIYFFRVYAPRYLEFLPGTFINRGNPLRDPEFLPGTFINRGIIYAIWRDVDHCWAVGLSVHSRSIPVSHNISISMRYTAVIGHLCLQ